MAMRDGEYAGDIGKVREGQKMGGRKEKIERKGQFVERRRRETMKEGEERRDG